MTGFGEALQRVAARVPETRMLVVMATDGIPIEKLVVRPDPDQEAVARVLVQGADGDNDRELLFNYRTEQNEVWDDPALGEEWKYTPVYPQPGSFGMRVDL